MTDTETRARDREHLQIPPALPATPDMICWLWAAIPHRNGTVHVAKAAQLLGVSTTTVYRWMKQADERNFTADSIPRLKQLAILRGHGTILWPDLDPVTRARADRYRSDAEGAHRLIVDDPDRIPDGWRTNGATDPHTVWHLWSPAARVYGLASGGSISMARKIARRAALAETVVIEEVTVTNRYAARVLKYRVLDAVDEHRCLPPAQLIPYGRTESWRLTGGEVDLRGFTEGLT